MVLEGKGDVKYYPQRRRKREETEKGMVNKRHQEVTITVERSNN